MCACCTTERAQVWDHCHTHGLVRAPPCGPCNTRHWQGWQAARGRAAAGTWTRAIADSADAAASRGNSGRVAGDVRGGTPSPYAPPTPNRPTAPVSILSARQAKLCMWRPTFS
ncbi:endonuclease domain-containing protein [Nonomuraea sp. NPDC004702]